jgi:hypothetical protein
VGIKRTPQWLDARHAIKETTAAIVGCEAGEKAPEKGRIGDESKMENIRQGPKPTHFIGFVGTRSRGCPSRSLKRNKNAG